MHNSHRDAPAELPSFRNLLVNLNKDLFEIANRKPFVWWDSAELLNIEVMVLILEDRRYFKHHGVDIKAITRELFKLITFKRFGGASTIDMQLVRTLTGYRDLTIRRKIYEMLLAIIIQFHYSKREILRSYLYCAYFGHGIRGADDASFRYLGCYAEDLNFNQAAEIASMLVYPIPKHPTEKWLNRIVRRANYAKYLYPKLYNRFT